MIRALFDLLVFAGMLALVLGVIGYIVAEANSNDINNPNE